MRASGGRVFRSSEMKRNLVPDRQEAIRRMHRLRAQGLSLWAIVAEVTAGGHRVSHQGVKAILGGGLGEPAAQRRL